MIHFLFFLNRLYIITLSLFRNILSYRYSGTKGHMQDGLSDTFATSSRTELVTKTERNIREDKKTHRFSKNLYYNSLKKYKHMPDFF